MSILNTHKIQDITCKFFVQDPRLFELASNLHRVSLMSTRAVEQQVPADISWTIGPSDTHEVWLGEAKWGHFGEQDDLYLQTQHLIDQLFLSKMPHLLQIHASAVISPQSGKAWIICGDSGCGKTSLALSAILSGWKWLSDEISLFSQQSPGSVLGFPRDFNIKERSFSYFPETAPFDKHKLIYSRQRRCFIRFINPELLIQNRLATEAPIGGFIFPEYDPAPQTHSLQKITPIESMPLLSASILHAPPWATPFLIRLLKNIAAYRLTYGDPRQIALETLQ